jgi:hypothetical protein
MFNKLKIEQMKTYNFKVLKNSVWENTSGVTEDCNHCIGWLEQDENPICYGGKPFTSNVEVYSVRAESQAKAEKLLRTHLSIN